MPEDINVELFNQLTSLLPHSYKSDFDFVDSQVRQITAMEEHKSYTPAEYEALRASKNQRVLINTEERILTLMRSLEFAQQPGKVTDDDLLQIFGEDIADTVVKDENEVKIVKPKFAELWKAAGDRERSELFGKKVLFIQTELSVLGSKLLDQGLLSGVLYRVIGGDFTPYSVKKDTDHFMGQGYTLEGLLKQVYDNGGSIQMGNELSLNYIPGGQLRSYSVRRNQAISTTPPLSSLDVIKPLVTPNSSPFKPL